MAILRKINSKAKATINTGFGSNTSDYGGRFINKDGRPNIEKRGVSFLEKISLYHTMLQMPRWKFLLLLLLLYIVLNIFFAIIYLVIGLENMSGIVAASPAEHFWEAFFFSTQTFTTVGYGRISPHGFTASFIASIEALVGLLSFAIATGLFYGRFSRPKAYVRFSEHALLAPFKDGLAIMVRVATYKNNQLTDAEAKLTAGIIAEEDGKPKNTFYLLDLEYEKVNALTLSWTIVHPINENSPFYKFTRADFENADAELVVFLKAFDDMFSNTVVARSSYTFKELVIGAKFIPMYHKDSMQQITVLDLEKLDAYQEMDISHLLDNGNLASEAV